MGRYQTGGNRCLQENQAARVVAGNLTRLVVSGFLEALACLPWEGKSGRLSDHDRGGFRAAL
jgi:hypothetical protein